MLSHNIFYKLLNIQLYKDTSLYLMHQREDCGISKLLTMTIVGEDLSIQTIINILS